MSFDKDALIHKLQTEVDRLVNENFPYEEIPNEEMWEDGEINGVMVREKIIHHVLEIGDWILVRRISNGK